MLAVIVTGGKQYKVQKDQMVQIDRLKGAEGDSVSFDKIVLMQDGQEVLVGDALSKSSVKATIVAHTRGRKIDVVKFKRRKRYSRLQGHKQLHTEVKIESIEVKPSVTKEAAKKTVAKEASVEKAVVKKAAVKKVAVKKAKVKNEE
jgi:large subunit ribosomal protein L21